jgi:hypothetical protein
LSIHRSFADESNSIRARSCVTTAQLYS